jgi:uncharacterized protein (UPF0335 family)
MGRPRGSKNKDHDHNGDDEVPLRNTIDGDELLSYIKRIERCDEDQRDISSDRQQIFKELKQAGYDRDTVREIVRKRKLTVEQRQAAAALLDQYLSALGDFASSPLGQAWADRMREEALVGR